MVLHRDTTHRRAPPEALADISTTLNVEDTHIVNYALKLDVRAWCAATAQRHGNSTASPGRRASALKRYIEVRTEQCLIGGLEPARRAARNSPPAGPGAARFSGLYDKAARAASLWFFVFAVFRFAV